MPETSQENHLIPKALEVPAPIESGEELLHSRAELKAIHDTTPVMMCVVDADRRVLYANAASSSSLAYRKKTCAVDMPAAFSAASAPLRIHRVVDSAPTAKPVVCWLPWRTPLQPASPVLRLNTLQVSCVVQYGRMW